MNPTLTPTANPTVTGVVRSFVEVVGSSNPDVLSDRDYLVTTSVTGSLTIDSNAGLTTAGAAFPRLTRVGGYLCIMGNRNLATLGTAFPVLGEFGTHSTGISLFVYNNAALRSLGTAFASLRRIPGTLLFNEIPC